MLRNILLYFTLCAGSLPLTLSAQSYCVPSVEIYGSTAPGITRVKLDGSPAIDRSSSGQEAYVNTNTSTTVAAGQAYNFSMTFTLDPSICPGMNLRVWIDFNGDYDFDDQ